MRSLLVLAALVLVPLVQADRATATAHLNVRTGPGIGFGKLWVARPGTGFPVLARDGAWLKVQLIQYRPAAGTGFFVDTAASGARPSDTIEVTLLSRGGRKLGSEFLPKSSLKLADSGAARKGGGTVRVHILREGWVYAGYTRAPGPGRIARTPKEGTQGFRLPDPTEPLPPLPWGRLRSRSPVYLPLASMRAVGQLDSGAVVQVLGEEKGFLRVQVSSTDLRDTLYIDLNQFYDANGGDTSTLVAGHRDSVGALGPIRKELVRFEPSRAFFGPGISRLVPVEVDLPLLLDGKGLERFTSYADLAGSLTSRKETHPRCFLPKDAADALVRLVQKDLEAVIAPKWFVEGGTGPFTFGLVLKTVALREGRRNPEEYLFHKYVRPTLDAYRPSLASLSPFQEIAVEVEYMEPGQGGAGLQFKTMIYRVPRSALEEINQGALSYRALFENAFVELKAGNT